MCRCRMSRAASSVVPDRHGEERLARHDVGDRPIDVVLEPQVAVGQDADEAPFLAPVLRDRHAGDPVLLHQLERFEDPVGGGEGDRVDDHPALGPLDAIDFRRLLLDRQVLVDDADAALLRHRDRQPRLGDGVHRRAGDRDVQADVAGEVRGDVDFARQDVRVLRHEQHVVKGQGGGQADRNLVGVQNIGPGFHSTPGLILPSAFCPLCSTPLRGTSCTSCRCRTGRDRCVRPSGSSRLTCRITSSPPVRAGRGGSATAGRAPLPLPRIAPNGDEAGGRRRVQRHRRRLRAALGRGRRGRPSPSGSSPTIGISRHR